MRTLRLNLLGFASLFLALPLAAQTQLDGSAGSLAEDLERLATEQRKTPRTLSLGRTVTGALDEQDPTLSNGAHIETWTYEGRAGEEVVFEMDAPSFDALLLLAYDAGRGPEVVARDDDGGGNYNARLATRLPVAGSYLVLATSAGPRQHGAYTVLAARGSEESAEADGAVLGRAALAAGRLAGDERRTNDGRPYDLWRFEGQRGERIRFAVDGVPASVSVVRPLSGGAVPVEGQSQEGGAAVLVDLPASSAYLVVVAGREPGARGSYRLRAEAVGVAPPAPPAAARLRTASASPADPAERYALLVGIDDYPGASNDLPSSVADVELMKRVLVEQYGFEEVNVLVLADRQATREHVIAAFDQHLGQAGPDGVAVFYYSGHGIQLEGNMGLAGADDPEEDGRDEALVLWGLGPQASILFDDELGALMDRLPAERALAILDACSSGTGSRGTLVKSVTPEGLGAALHVPEPYEQVTGKTVTLSDDAAGDGAGGLLDSARGPMRHLLLAATRPEEFALARRDPWPGGQVASAFTYFLTAGMEAANERTTFEALMTRVRPLTSRYAAGEGGRQTPQLEGPAAAMTLRRYLAQRGE